MGQFFSLLGRTDAAKGLERVLADQKGKCAKTDRIVAELERDLARVREERDGLKQAETRSKALEDENAELERRIASLTEGDEATATSRAECEDCTRRIAALREQNAALRRQLIAPTKPMRPVSDDTPEKFKILKQQIMKLESQVKQSKVTLRRVMAFAFQEFSLATYKTSWNVRDITRSRTGDSIKCVISIDTFEYRAFLRYRGTTLTIQADDITRTVSNAGPLWAAIVGTEASPKPVSTPIVKPNKEPKPAIADRYRATAIPPSNKPAIADRYRATDSSAKLTISKRFAKR